MVARPRAINIFPERTSSTISNCQGRERVNLVAGAVGPDDQGFGPIVDDLGGELFRDLQDFAASIEGAPDLQERDLGFDRGLAGVVDGVNDVDQLGRLPDDLFQRIWIAAARNRDAREPAVLRRHTLDPR